MMLWSVAFSVLAMATPEEKSPAEAVKVPLSEQCVKNLTAMPGRAKADQLAKACALVEQLPDCASENGEPIFHFDRAARPDNKDPRNILVFSLIHGDELPAGSVGRSWMERLTVVEPRNRWRVIPILNPDGWRKKTRVNARGVDVNRNFPTKDWEKAALEYWKKHTKSDPRRYPGPTGASEKETRCAIAHIEEFKPDLLLSIHTPYGVLDFDGPDITPPNFPHIPWRRLGNYPGSLGRFMWVDRAKPILTIELHQKGVAEQLDRFDRLQDITGDIAIAAEKKMLKSQQKEAKKDKPAPNKTPPQEKSSQ
jgi:murein peptide amidase A